MSPLHSQTSVPQGDPQRWWVRNGSHDTRQNQFKTQHCVPGPGTIVPRVRRSQISGCSFAVPWRPVNASDPRLRCHGRVAKAPTRWPSLSMLAEWEWRKHWTKQKIQAWFTQRDTTKHVLTHPSMDRKATISQTTFSNEFTWMKSFILCFNFYWWLFLRAQLTNKSALVDNKSMLVQAMDWHRVGDKPLPDTVHCRIEGMGMSWRGLTRINI